MLRELAEAVQALSPLAENEFTISMFMQANDMTRNIARPAIEQLEQMGKIVQVGDRVYNGKRHKAWRKVA